MDYRQRLLARKDEIEQLIKKKQDNLMIPLAETTDELSMYDQHPADIASELYEREKDNGLLELLEFELEKVNDAVDKLNNGTYG
ncbi:MAG: yteA family sporulation protein, partial [Syntrophomonadaceae bacterium]|nr:yteA family sporulation protein [Syntrophomonadaceae bacterium]